MGRGCAFWFYFYFSWRRETKAPTSKDKRIVCYVDAMELSTDVGLDNFFGDGKVGGNHGEKMYLSG
jgi:hypothetical protein